MTSQESFAALAELARRLRNDPRYMSYVLATYQKQEGFMDEDLAQELGTLPALVSRLAVCKRPDTSSAEFAEQVRELADYTLIDEARLASILRQVEAIKKLASRPLAIRTSELEAEPGPSHTGLLAAARDRYEQDSEESPDKDEESESQE
jgi:hypothetical protein